MIDSRGSRTQLMTMMKELDDAVQAVEEANDEVRMMTDDDELVRETDDYIKAAQKQYEEAYQCAQQYLQSRQGEAPSVVSGMKSHASQKSSASRKADVALQMKQMEVKQLQRKHEREKQEQDLHRENELQAAKDAEELAKLHAQLVEASDDNLNWDRRKDFDDETAVKEAADKAQGEVQWTNTAEHQRSTKPPVSKPGHGVNTELEVQASTESHDQGHQYAPMSVVQSEPSFLRSLPQIKLPKFSGSPGEWPRWFALFQTLVHNQKTLNSTEKMVHLQSAVAGAAQQVISGMLFEGGLYEDALKALKERFGNREDIV